MIVRELLIRLGVQFDDKDALGKANKTAKKMADALASVGTVFAVGKVLGGLKAVADEAGRASDKLVLLKNTFQDQSAGVMKWAEESAAKLGRSKYSLQEYAATMGTTLLSVNNYDRELTAKMATGLAGLAVDLGSVFSQYTDEQIMDRLRSGMLGSSEAVDQLGINLKVEALKAHAATIGIKNFNAQSSETIKTQVRFSKILADTKDKQGNAARTAGEYDNSLRTLQESFKETRIELGLKLLPVASKVVGVFAQAAKAVRELVADDQKLVVVFTTLAAVMAPFVASMVMANAGLILFVAGIAAVYLIAEDLYKSLSNGKGVIHDFFEALMGKDDWEAVRNAWKQGTESIGTYLYDALHPEEAKKRQELKSKETLAREKLTERGLFGGLTSDEHTYKGLGTYDIDMNWKNRANAEEKAAMGGVDAGPRGGASWRAASRAAKDARARGVQARGGRYHRGMVIEKSTAPIHTPGSDWQDLKNGWQAMWGQFERDRTRPSAQKNVYDPTGRPTLNAYPSHGQLLTDHRTVPVTVVVQGDATEATAKKVGEAVQRAIAAENEKQRHRTANWQQGR